MAFLQCSKCDKEKGKCKCEKPEFLSYLDKNDHKQIQKESKSRQELEKNAIFKIKGKIHEYFVESILVEGESYFLCFDHKTKTLSTKKELLQGEKLVKPIQQNQCGYIPYDFSKQEIKQIIKNKISKEKLFDKIKQQIDNFIVIRELDKYLILGDIMLSYEQEHINTTHFLYVVGETESGKSSVVHLFRMLAYRCLYGEDIPNADIYNFLGTDEEGAGTIAEDEAQDLAYEKEKIRTYKNSYSKGALKPRILQTLNSKKQVFYKTFCFKVFAGESIPEDKGFRERLAIIHMIEGRPNANIKRLTGEEKTRLLDLRKALLVYKIQNIHNQLVQIDSNLHQRDQELWEDFLRVCYGTKYYSRCKEVVAFYTAQRHEAIWNSLEARIFKIVVRILSEGLEFQFEAFWNYLVNEQDDIAGHLEKETFYPHDYAQKITRNYLAILFEGKFHAIRRQKYHTENGQKHKITVYQFKQDVIESLIKKYNISESSGVSGTSGKLADHVDDVDGSKINHWVI